MIDDKLFVILSVTIISLALLCIGDLTSEKVNLLNCIVTGLFGIAVGKNMK